MNSMEKPLRLPFGLTISAFAMLFLTMIAAVGGASESMASGVRADASGTLLFSCLAALLLAGAIILELRLFRSANLGRRVGLSVLVLLQLGVAAFAAFVFRLGIKA